MFCFLPVSCIRLGSAVFPFCYVFPHYPPFSLCVFSFAPRGVVCVSSAPTTPHVSRFQECLVYPGLGFCFSQSKFAFVYSFVQAHFSSFSSLCRRLLTLSPSADVTVGFSVFLDGTTAVLGFSYRCHRLQPGFLFITVIKLLKTAFLQACISKS